MVNLPQDPSVDVRILKQMLTESLSASYKLFWFSGIFEEILCYGFLFPRFSRENI